MSKNYSSKKTDKLLRAIKPVVYVANKKIQSIYSFEIEQAFCEHHTFTLVLDHDVFQKSFMDKPLDVFDLVGLPVLIGMGMGPEDEWDKVIDFYGIIRKARIKAEMGSHGKVILEGCSPTVLFEQEPRMDVFAGVPLSSILNRFYNGINKRHLDISIDTAFNSFFEFVMQYKETDWQFLQRISRQFGENLYYDGTKLIFGKFDNTHKIETLEYDSEISEFDFSTRLLPANFDICHYLPDSDTRMFESAPSNISDSSPYTDKAFRRGREIAELLPPTLTLDMPVKGQADMNEIIKSKQNRRAAEMVYFNGVTKSIKVALGRVVRIVQSEKVSQNTNLGDYRIVSCKRTYSANEEYRCVFSAIPDKLPVVPVPYLPEPVAGPVIARVFSNEDPLGLGRVEVHFPFATNRYTYWLRVQTPYAGSSEKVGKGRGFTFIPEKGDQVIVSFEENNPNKPYVSGSLFHGKNATGGGEDNYIKSIVTNSGIRIEMNDADGSLLISDSVGSKWHMDGAGNIEVNAPKSLKLKATNIQIDAANDLELTAGNSLMASAGNLFNTVSRHFKSMAMDTLRMFSATSLFSAEQTMDMQAKNMNALGSEKLFLHSDKLLHANSQGDIELKSKESINSTQKADSAVFAATETIALAVVEFRTIEGAYNGEFGFDWLRIDEKQTAEKGYEGIIEGGYNDGTTDLTKDEAFAELVKEYENITITPKPVPLAPWESKMYTLLPYLPPCQLYFVPYLNLYSEEYSKTVNIDFPGQPKPTYQATLRVLVEIAVELDRIEFEYDKNLFTVSPSVLAGGPPCGKTQAGTITITCNKDFGTQQSIRAYAYPKNQSSNERKLAGKILLAPNDTAHRKEAKFVFVSVIINDVKGRVKKGSFTTTEQVQLCRTLYQALVQASITVKKKNSSTGAYEPIELDLTKDPYFNKLGRGFVNRDGKIRRVSKYGDDMLKYIADKFRENPSNAPYSEHFPIFSFGVRAQSDGTLFGYCDSDSDSLGQIMTFHQNVVIFNAGADQDNFTVSHEALHGFGLFHTHKDHEVDVFGNIIPIPYSDQRYIYHNGLKEPLKATDNIMNYNTNTGNTISSWKWQWDIIRKNV